MGLTPGERKRRSEQAKRNWADPAIRAKMIEGVRKPRPGRAVGMEQRQAKRRKAELHNRKRRLAYQLAKPATAKTDLRSIRTELDALRRLMPLGDWLRLADKYYTFQHLVDKARREEKQRRKEERRRQWAEAE